MSCVKIFKIASDCSGLEACIVALNSIQNISYSHIFSSDIDKHVNKMIIANYKPDTLFGDITTRDINKVKDIDIYVAGFPCQTFSNIGDRKGFEDPRGNIFFSCLKVIKYKEPKFFILENVKGLKTHDNGNTFKVILGNLNSLENYSIYWEVLNTKDYGIPQSRPRLFIVGIRVDVQTRPFSFPEHIVSKDIRDYIDTADTSIKPFPPRIINSNYMDKIPKDSVFVDFSLYGRSTFPNSNKLCPCICRKSDIWCVPMNRPANIKELLSLQGFPENIKKVVSDSQIKKQIGNSMSVNVLVNIYNSIFDSMYIV
jgi:DNA (cytosine-5)-methyltransferase 1